jgi:quinol monooxygenase YgiN
MIQSIVATIKVKPGQEAQFQAVALRLVAAVRANEPGCLLYTLSKGEDASTFVFMERYESQDAMKAHRGTDHFRTIGREMGAFMEGAPSVVRMVELG